MREARLYRQGEGGYTDCHLCAFRCHIADGKRGVCGVRENIGGTLYTHVYGRLIAQHADPIEKKPLFHFMPGTRSYSIATVGCNFRCLHCQNAEISQMPRDEKRVMGDTVSPVEVVECAEDDDCSTIAYTYTEPTIFFEFADDVATMAKDRGLKNIFVTNGYMTPECLDELSGKLDAANVDVKSFSESFYRKVCGAKLSPVLESVEKMVEMGVWVEITTLIIPTLNDSPEELKQVAEWIAKTDDAIPWHISAFHPSYRLSNLPPTPRETVERAREIGLEAGLKYVYTGNLPGMKGESTFCYSCGEILIERHGFTVKKNVVVKSKCPHCHADIHGVGL